MGRSKNVHKIVLTSVGMTSHSNTKPIEDYDSELRTTLFTGMRVVLRAVNKHDYDRPLELIMTVEEARRLAGGLLRYAEKVDELNHKGERALPREHLMSWD